MTEPDLFEVPDVLSRPQWVDEFETHFGRPLRILNLGNIANNAFQNSKIMRRAGIEADCVAYDYYHVMGTAEWEDAEYKGSIGDQFYPDWWRVKFKNYSRPNWFIQGPKKDCIEYIHSRYNIDKSRKKTDRLWRTLEYHTQQENYKKSSLNKFSPNPMNWPSRFLRKVQFFLFTIRIYLRSPFLFKQKYERQADHIVKIGRTLFTLIGLPFALIFLLLSFCSDKIVGFLALIPRENRSNYFELKRARRKILVIKLRQKLYPLVYSVVGLAARIFRRIVGKRFGAVFGDDVANGITQTLGVRSKSPDRISVDMSIAEIQARRADRRARRDLAKNSDRPESPIVSMEENIEDFLEQKSKRETKTSAYYSAYLFFLELAYPDQSWIVGHYESNADEPSEDIRQDVIVAKALAKEWEGVFEYYDVILAYSTDGILPMAGSEMPFFTYEHGTLRSIPFENNFIGRLCASSYRTCEALMVTNLDNIDKPQHLKMMDDQVVFLPHAVDDKKLLGYQQKHQHLIPKNHERPIFLCPARHDWGDEDPSLMKGNDKLLHAVKIVVDEGYRPKIILFDWGRHVEKSRQLIKTLGIDELISWVKPMKKTELWKSYFRCHAIVDQFSIPAFGGVTFEGLTFSKRIITSIDESLAKEFFGEIPPILNCSDPDGIAEAMKVVLDDPEDNAGLGRAGGNWAKCYHSSQRILDLQLAAFERTLRRRLIYDDTGIITGERPNIRIRKS